MSDHDESDDEYQGRRGSGISAANDDRRADLGRANVERFFNRAENSGGFGRTLAERQFLPPRSNSNSASGSTVSRSSTISSMEVSYHTPTTTDRSGSPAPSLVSWSTIDSPSISSGRRDSVIGNYYGLHTPESGLPHNGLLRGTLPCSFAFLNCEFRSASLREWDGHCLSHFRGHIPSHVSCPFRDCTWEVSEETSNDVWRSRFFHILGFHKHDLDVNTTDRPPRNLVGHLWRTGVISDAEVKEIRKNGRLSGDLRFITRGGPTRDRRGRR